VVTDALDAAGDPPPNAVSTHADPR
jgi:hypothetical protein